MNRRRREKLAQAGNMLERASDILMSVIDEETYALDNTPENLQGSEAYSHREDVIDSLEDALSDIEHAGEQISAAGE